MGARKKVSAVTKRVTLGEVATSLRASLEKVEAIQGEDRDINDDFAHAIKALRMIESAPPGTPARNLIGVAASTLSRIGLKRLKRSLG